MNLEVTHQIFEKHSNIKFV